MTTVARLITGRNVPDFAGRLRDPTGSGEYHMKNVTLAIIAVLAGCASEKINHTQTSNPTSEKVYHTQTSDPTGLTVLVGRNARIEGRELIWSCVYQTAEGRVVVEQREECGRALWTP